MVSFMKTFNVGNPVVSQKYFSIARLVNDPANLNSHFSEWDSTGMGLTEMTQTTLSNLHKYHIELVGLTEFEAAVIYRRGWTGAFKL